MSYDLNSDHVDHSDMSEHGHGDHNWKEAYADFVTALMAFFILMWVVGAANDAQKEAIAEQFSPNLILSKEKGGGEGILKGSNLASGITSIKPGSGTPFSGFSKEPTPQINQDEQEADTKDLTALEERSTAYTGESALDEGIKKHVITKLTDEYLRIEFQDMFDEKLFDGTAPTENLEHVIDHVLTLAEGFDQKIAVEAYVSSQAIVVKDRDELKLSLERAKRVKSTLEAKGIQQGRVVQITGHSANSHKALHPMSSYNNRIALVFLKN